MAEYIEREAAMKAVAAFFEPVNTVEQALILNRLLKKLMLPPAADVVTVVHGRWIEEDGVQICSNCGEEHSWAEYRATYCEDCGARMDGDG